LEEIQKLLLGFDEYQSKEKEEKRKLLSYLHRTAMKLQKSDIPECNVNYNLFFEVESLWSELFSLEKRKKPGKRN